MDYFSFLVLFLNREEREGKRAVKKVKAHEEYRAPL